MNTNKLAQGKPRVEVRTCEARRGEASRRRHTHTDTSPGGKSGRNGEGGGRRLESRCQSCRGGYRFASSQAFRVFFFSGSCVFHVILRGLRFRQVSEKKIGLLLLLLLVLEWLLSLLLWPKRTRVSIRLALAAKKKSKKETARHREFHADSSSKY